jgi:hypothetical protein
MFGRVFVEVAVHALGEVAIQGMGYLVCRPFKHDVKPDGLLTTVVGLTFWMVFGVLVYLAFRYGGETAIRGLVFLRQPTSTYSCIMPPMR